jgi:hypothetical protein
MGIYSVRYQSMYASYGPSFIEADSEIEARRKFAGSAFSKNEMLLITARPVSINEMKRALRTEGE